MCVIGVFYWWSGSLNTKIAMCACICSGGDVKGVRERERDGACTNLSNNSKRTKQDYQRSKTVNFRLHLDLNEIK